MSKFVSKLAYVDAIQFDGSNFTEVVEFGEGDVSVDETNSVLVTTNNGVAELLPDHWLIKGVSDFYPCDPETFATRWQESVPVAAEYRANPDARVVAIQYLGDENREEVLQFGNDRIDLGEDGYIRVETNSGSVILEESMWLLWGPPTGYIVIDPVAFRVRWLPVE